MTRRRVMGADTGGPQRKARMAELATGGFVVLPGGFGTFEEVMEMVTWNQLRIHRRPVVVLNSGWHLIV